MGEEPPAAGERSGDRSGGLGGRTSPAPYRTSLRVYEPEGSVAWWDDVVPVAVPPDAEPLAALQRLLATPPAVAPSGPSGAAYLLTAGDRRFWCPTDERQRCWEALGTARAEGAALLDRAFPADVLDDAEAAGSAWSRTHPDAVPHVRTSAWHVPIRWFVAFEPAERVVDTGPDHTVVYRATMVDARRRLSRAHAVLRRKAPKDRLTGAVRDLGAWVNEFHPHGVLELDYGGLVDLLGFDEAAADTSVGTLARVLASLAADRDADAWARYRAVVERWRAVQRLGRAS